ncbi:serine hydrolase [Levilactobacillus mulengensis]|uniref:serine hydrolase n=1 Tax=Levilactobacillus mulengensis TaxID=2486025 RepID=UPI000F78503B|nr:serine hydrolase [Levilactobacillus mulengensis]
MKKWGLWLLVGVVSLGLVGCQSRGQANQAAKKMTSSRSASASSSVIKRKTPKAKTANAKAKKPVPAAPFKQIAQSTMGHLKGQNAVFIQTTTGQTLSWHNRSQKAASDIKLFILATVYRQVAAGKFDLAATYTLREADKVGGTGNLQAQAAGTRVTNRDLLKDMMTVSDNTATNIIIREVGGLAAVNQEIKRLGATQTVLRRKMMDQKALAAGRDNETSARDLGNLLMKIWRHQLISRAADTAILKLMAANTNHAKLPKLVPASRQIYNKTGEFDTYGVENDAAIFAQGKQAVVVVALSQNGELSQQVPAMNQLGKQIDAAVFS